MFFNEVPHELIECGIAWMLSTWKSKFRRTCVLVPREKQREVPVWSNRAYGENTRNTTKRSRIMDVRTQNNKQVNNQQYYILSIEHVSELCDFDLTKSFNYFGQTLFRCKTGTSQGSPLAQSMCECAARYCEHHSAELWKFSSKWVACSRARWTDDIYVSVCELAENALDDHPDVVCQRIADFYTSFGLDMKAEDPTTFVGLVVCDVPDGRLSLEQQFPSESASSSRYQHFTGFIQPSDKITLVGSQILGVLDRCLMSSPIPTLDTMFWIFRVNGYPQWALQKACRQIEIKHPYLKVILMKALSEKWTTSSATPCILPRSCCHPGCRVPPKFRCNWCGLPVCDRCRAEHWRRCRRPMPDKWFRTTDRYTEDSGISDFFAIPSPDSP